MRNGPTIISRSPIGAMISAPPSSTVITIERDTTPQQKPPIRRIEGGVPVIRTRVERPHLPSNNSPGSSKQHHQQQQQQQQQQFLHRQIEKATHSIQSIIVDPDVNNSNNNSNAHHSTVNYVDQLKATRLTKERDSVLSLSDHASGGNVSPNRSSGFTSPAMLLSTTSDREPTPQQPEARIQPTPQQPEARIRSSSPLPASVSRRLKTKTYEKFVKPCKPGMYQFFMEQHIDSVIRQSEDRNHRALQLLNEMAAAQFPETMQEQFLKVLRQKESKYIRLKRQKMDKNMFDIIKYVGVGAFGKVALVRKKDTQQTYAMKILSKEDVIQKKQSSHVKAERDILSEANSPWVVKLFFSFQDSRNLYFIMEFVPGGDMMQLLIVKGVFEEKLARFYIAELTCAVEYVHELGFIHRDIKPDNILIDRNGHIKLTDFGLCTGLRWTHDKRRYVIYEKDNPNVISHIREDSFSLPPEIKQETKMKLLEHRHHRKRNAAHSIVGTANYMAPEVARQTGHTQNCDWWSVGVILYEMTFGRPPFMSQTENPHETQYKIMHWDRFLDLTSMGHLPSPLSETCVDMIARLCCEEKDRIGTEFIPQVKHAEDTSNFDVGDLNCQDLLKDATLKSGHNFNPAFYDFTFRHFFDYEGGGQPTGRQTQQRPSLAPLIEASSKQSKASTSTTTMAQSSMPPQINGNHYNNEMPRQNDGKQPLSKQATTPVKSLASVAQQHQQQQAYEQQSAVPLRREPPLPQKPFTRILPSTNGKPFDRNAPVFVRRQQRVHLNGQLRRDLFPQSSNNNNQIHEHENGESKL
uniref:Protein kinase domain-containing protein n=1 Tax=Panagrolaimus sp. PS1159 TaxID=55785 RepID=A0AC35GEX4_9BILA